MVMFCTASTLSSVTTQLPPPLTHMADTVMAHEHIMAGVRVAYGRYRC